jgi:hypothetical protein
MVTDQHHRPAEVGGKFQVFPSIIMPLNGSFPKPCSYRYAGLKNVCLTFSV